MESPSFEKSIIKKLIVEIRHPANLLHSQKTQAILNDLVPEFDRVIKEIRGGTDNDSIQLISEELYTKLVADWDKMTVFQENLSDRDLAKSRIRKYLIPTLARIGINTFTRIGIRTFYLIPFNGSFENLVVFFRDNFFKNVGIYEPIGNVVDVGITSLTLKDSKYKINFNVGPFSKDEFKKKFSEFKKFEDKFESALMVDLDLYVDRKGTYKISQFIDEAIDASSNKITEFLNKLS